jgi:anti-sigma regulatory factor (Ser/Thr protein kinase)
MSASDGPVVLDLASESGALRVVREALRGLARDADVVRLAAGELDEVEIALHEACTNAIRHAHGCDAEKRFRVELTPRGDALEILVRDHGRPFEVDGVSAPPPEALQEGGYGISIIKSWMDEVTVSREGDGNVLRLVRRYRARSGGTDAGAR